MKPGIPPEDLVQAMPLQRLLGLGNSLLQLVEHRLSDAAADDPQRVSFQDGPNLEELLDLLLRILRGDESAGGQGLDQTLRLQFVKRLTNGSTTDPKLFGEVFLRQSLPWIEPALQDGGLEVLVGSFPGWDNIRMVRHGLFVSKRL